MKGCTALEILQNIKRSRWSPPAVSSSALGRGGAVVISWQRGGWMCGHSSVHIKDALTVR